MFNPLNSNQDFGSYVDLRKRVLQRAHSTKIDEQIIELARKVVDDALAAEKVVLSAPEKRRLLSQTMQSILDEVTGKLGDGGLPA